MTLCNASERTHFQSVLDLQIELELFEKVDLHRGWGMIVNVDINPTEDAH